MKKTTVAILALIIASFVLSILLYSKMPPSLASHWNIEGNVDGYMSKFWGLFLIPIISFAILLLFFVIPKIDPLKANIEKFRKYFDGFMVLLSLFLFYLYLLTVFWNLGFRFSMNKMMMPAMGILFFYAGILVEHAKRNWFVGIRTPWTLSSDKVWEKTHKLGGKLFKAAGIIAFFGIFFQKYAFWFVMIPIAFVVVLTAVYSYVEFRRK